MAQSNRFIIHNDLPDPLTLDIEPEGVFFSLSHGEEVSVSEVFTTAPVTIKVTASPQGEPIVCIWPGDGEVQVEKDGVDIFDLVQKASVSDTVSLQLGSPPWAKPVATTGRPRK